jgi:hypothetical protein
MRHCPLSQFVTGIMDDQYASRQSIRDLLRAYRFTPWFLRLLLTKHKHGYSAVLVTKCDGKDAIGFKEFFAGGAAVIVKSELKPMRAMANGVACTSNSPGVESNGSFLPFSHDNGPRHND